MVYGEPPYLTKTHHTPHKKYYKKKKKRKFKVKTNPKTHHLKEQTMLPYSTIHY